MSFNQDLNKQAQKVACSRKMKKSFPAEICIYIYMYMRKKYFLFVHQKNFGKAQHQVLWALWWHQLFSTRPWIYTLWIYSLSTLQNTDENRIFFVRSPQAFWQSLAPGALRTLGTLVVLYSLNQATMTSPGKNETRVCE